MVVVAVVRHSRHVVLLSRESWVVMPVALDGRGRLLIVFVWFSSFRVAGSAEQGWN